MTTLGVSGGGRVPVRGDVVVCLGAQSDRLTRPVGVRLPIYPMRGYSITVDVTELARDAPHRLYGDFDIFGHFWSFLVIISQELLSFLPPHTHTTCPCLCRADWCLHFGGMPTFRVVRPQGLTVLEPLHTYVIRMDEQRVRQLRHYFGPAARISQPSTTPVAPCDMICVAPILIACGLVLAIRWHDQSTPLDLGFVHVFRSALLRSPSSRAGMSGPSPR